MATGDFERIVAAVTSNLRCPDGNLTELIALR